MERLFISFQMMHKSQFPKIGPYDWFCGPGSHIYIYIMLCVCVCVCVCLEGCKFTLQQYESINKALGHADLSKRSRFIA